MPMRQRPVTGKLWMGIAAGALGGLIASWVMNQSQALMARMDTREDSAQTTPSSQQDQQEPATVRVAERVYELAFHTSLREDQKQAAEPFVHYGFGSLMGAFYGGLAAVFPVAASGAGTLFGATLWLFADEVAVPVLGLSKGPLAYPLAVHLQGLAAHLIYGLTTDGVRRAGIRIMEKP